MSKSSFPRRTFAVAALAAAASLSLAGPAMAKCGTKQLDGNWRINANLSSVVDVTIANGLMTVPGEGSFPISQGKGCKVTITIPGLVLTGSSEALSGSSTVKPRKIYAGSTAPQAWFVLIRR